MRAPIMLSVLLVTPALVRAAGEDGPMLIVLKATAGTRGPFVRLAEIADLPNDPYRLRAYAAEVLFGLAPEAGGTRNVEAAEVLARLRESGIAPGRLRIDGAPRSCVFLEGSVAEIEGEARIASPAPRETDRPARPERPGKRQASSPGGKGESGPRDLIEKGDPVVIQSAGKAILIEDRGRALAAAGPGGLVEVLNLRTQRKIVVRVAGPGVVAPVEPAPEEGEKVEKSR